MSTPTNPPAKHPPRERMPFHECYILIEVDDNGEEHATFHASPAARDQATLEAIWFGGPDESDKEEAEHYLQELREKGSLSFEGDPPLRWRTLSDYIKEHTALLQEERARAFEEAYQEWRRKNPDFEPENRYDDFFKDAFYLGFGRGKETAELLAKAARSPGDAEKGE